MNSYIAWIGTGQCDPNKGLIESLVVVGILVGWLIVIMLIKKVLKTKKSKIFRYSAVALLVIVAISAAFIAWAYTWLMLGCAR